MALHLTSTFGAVPHRIREGENIIMRLQTNVLVLNKKESQYTGRDGQIKQAYRITIGQDDNSVIAELPINADIYQAIEKNKSYDLVCEYRSTRNGGNYMVVLSSKLAKPLL